MECRSGYGLVPPGNSDQRNSETTGIANTTILAVQVRH